jgi:hypothetical protein
MREAKRLRWSERRVTVSSPSLQYIVSIKAQLATAIVTTGAMKPGRRAMSANVSPGEMKTPTKRPRNDLVGGAGSPGVVATTLLIGIASFERAGACPPLQAPTSSQAGSSDAPEAK